MARFKFAGAWFDAQNAVVQSGTITVYLAGSLTLATAYESETGAVLTNSQTTTEDDGSFSFWIDDGDYGSTQKFRFIGTKTGFKDLDSQQTDNLQIVLLGASSLETLTNKTISTDDNTITINEADIQDLGTAIALVADNLSVFAATTSLQLLGVISDETGTGLLVFGTSPTIITPTIASFLNATHNHSNAAGAGDLTDIQATSLTLTGTTETDTNTLTKGNILKAQATFGPDGVLDSSYNISSVDDDAQGDWGVNINTNMSDAFPIPVVSCTSDTTSQHNHQIGIDFAGVTAGTVEIICVENNDSTTEDDPAQIHLLIGGNQ